MADIIGAPYRIRLYDYQPVSKLTASDTDTSPVYIVYPVHGTEDLVQQPLEEDAQVSELFLCKHLPHIRIQPRGTAHEHYDRHDLVPRLLYGRDVLADPQDTMDTVMSSVVIDVHNTRLPGFSAKGTKKRPQMC